VAHPTHATPALPTARNGRAVTHISSVADAPVQRRPVRALGSESTCAGIVGKFLLAHTSNRALPNYYASS
jgi:hypothetical protein